MYEFHLPDMTCGHCVATVTKTVQALDAQATLEFDREARRVKVETSVPQEAVAAALSEEGYPPAA